MTTPLEDIRFLADSPNRFTALQTLAVGPHTRAALQSETEASKATMSRLLGDFEDRGWVVRNGQHYELTPLGEYVAESFIEHHDHMTTASDLRELLPWFPLGAVDVEFDLDVLTGAEITAATPENPLASVARVLEIERESDATRTLADRLPEACVDARHEAVVESEGASELITTPTVVESVLASSYADAFEAVVAAEESAVYVHDGALPSGGLHDGTAYLIVADDEDNNVGVIETDDPAVVERLVETFEAYREAATLLSPSDLERGTESAWAGP